MVVNTAGWISGFGLELLTAELELAQCHVVVEITGTQPSVFPALPLTERFAFLRISVPTYPHAASPLPNILRPPVRRSLCLESLMAAARLYSVPLNRLVVAFVQATPDDFVLTSINFRYVFLAAVEGHAETVRQNATRLPAVAELRERPTEVRGVGLVSVDPQQGVAYVKTTLPPDALAAVNTLVYSATMDSPSLPPLQYDAPAPYMAFAQETFGAVREQFKFLRRN